MEQQTFPKAKYPEGRPRDFQSVWNWLTIQPDFLAVMNELAEL